MKLFLWLGKLLALVFWLVVLANWLQPFAEPFAQGLWLLAGVVGCVHLLEMLLFNGRFQGRGRPWRDRLQVLLFGVFHALALPQPGAETDQAAS